MDSSSEREGKNTIVADRIGNLVSTDDVNRVEWHRIQSEVQIVCVEVIA